MTNQEEIRKTIADELLVDVKYVVINSTNEDYLDFSVNGAAYTAKLTKQGKIKKNSIRRDFA